MEREFIKPHNFGVNVGSEKCDFIFFVRSGREVDLKYLYLSDSIWCPGNLWIKSLALGVLIDNKICH